MILLLDALEDCEFFLSSVCKVALFTGPVPNLYVGTSCGTDGIDPFSFNHYLLLQPDGEKSYVRVTVRHGTDVMAVVFEGLEAEGSHLLEWDGLGIAPIPEPGEEPEPPPIVPEGQYVMHYEVWCPASPFTALKASVPFKIVPAVFRLDPSSLQFTTSEGGPDPEPQSVTISAAEDTVWSVTTFGPPCPWLSVQPDEGFISGCGAQQIQISVSGAGAAVGVNSCLLSFNNATIAGWSDGPDPPLSLWVKFTITPYGPTILLAPTDLTFYRTVSGNGPTPKTVTLTNTGAPDTVLKWDAMILSAPWFQVSPPSGTLEGGQSQLLTISFVGAGPTDPGSYPGLLVITDPDAVNSPQVANLTLVLLDPPGPDDPPPPPPGGDDDDPPPPPDPAPGLPQLQVVPTEIVFVATQDGGNPSDQFVLVKNAGEANSVLVWNSVEGIPWLEVVPPSDFLPAGLPPQDVLLKVDTAGLKAADSPFVGTVTFEAPFADGAPDQVQVTLILNHPPGTFGELPPTLQFRATEGGLEPLDQPVTISNVGPPESLLGWSVLSSASWLSAQPNSGLLAGFGAESGNSEEVAVAVSVVGLSAGLYEATLTPIAPGNLPDGNLSPATDTPAPIVVKLTVDPPGPAIRLSETALGFSGVAGETPPAAAVVTLTNAGTPGTTLNWSAASGAPWLSVAPPGGQLSAGASVPLSIAVDASVGPGTHVAAVTVSDPAANGSPAVIEVVFEVVASKSAIDLSTNFLAFDAAEGGADPAPVQIVLANSGPPSSLLDWNAVSDQPWLSVAPAAGAELLPGGSSVPLAVSVSAAGLAAGDYAGTLVFGGNAANAPRTIEVTLSVHEAVPIIRLEPTVLTFAAVEGQADPLVGTVTLTNIGTADLEWTAVASQPWVSVVPASPPIPPGGSVELTVTATAGGLMAAAGAYGGPINIVGNAANSPQTIRVDLGVSPDPDAPPPPPGTTPAQPDPNQKARLPNTDERSRFPRWLPLAGVRDDHFDETVESFEPNGSREALAVDSRNVVHVVVLDGGEVAYFTDRWETRRANGFSTRFAVSSAASLNVENAVIAAAPVADGSSEDNIDVVWLQKTVGASFDIYHRRLRQGPAEPGWGPIAKLTSSVAPPQGAAFPHTFFDSPHVAADPDGGVHLVCRRVEQQTASSTTTTILYAKAEPGDSGFGPPVTVQTLTGDGELLFAPRVSGGPGGVGHVAWQRGFDDSSTVQLRYRSYGGGPGGPTTVFFDPDGFGFDLAVGRTDPPTQIPHFAVTTTPILDEDGNVIQPGEILYIKGSGGVPEQINSSALNATGAHIEVDERDLARILWTIELETGVSAILGNPDLEDVAGLRPAYAARIEDPAGGGFSWHAQEPMEEDFVGSDQKQRLFGAVSSMAMSRTGVVHFLEFSHFGQECYSRSYEPNLGEQDSFLMFGIGPNVSANAGNGNVTGSLPIFSSRGVGFATNFSLVYNSMEPDKSVISPGWSHNYHLSVTDHAGASFKALVDVATLQKKEFLTLRLGDGRAVVFERVAGKPYCTADPEYGYFSKLQRFPAGVTSAPTGYKLTTKFGVVYEFDGEGRLVKILDTQQTPNTMVFAYEANAESTIAEAATGTSERLLAKITDSAQRHTHLTYGNRNNLTKVEDPNATTYAIDYTAAGTIRKVRFPLGVAWSFVHGSKHEGQNTETVTPGEPPKGFERETLLREVRTPRGNEWTLNYYPDNRSAGSADPSETHVAEAEGSAGVLPPPAGRAATRVLTYTDVVGGAPASGSFARFTNRRLFETKVHHEPRRTLAEKVTDPDEKFFVRKFFGAPGATDGFRNLESFTDKGSMQIVAGLPKVEKNITSYTYHGASNIEGGDPVVFDNLASISRPGVDKSIAYEYTATRNRVKKVRDARDAETVYDYDGSGNLELITYPDTGADLRITADPGDGDDPQTAPATESFAYDPQGRVSVHTDPNGGQTTFAYNDPAGTGLVSAITRPAHANSEGFTYDKLGNTKTHKLPMGGTTAFDLDKLYRVKSQTEPAADGLTPTTVFSYDLDSNVEKVRDPRGSSTSHVYDALGRLTTTTNAALDSMSIRYDPEGNTRGVRDFSEDGVTHATFDALGRTSKSMRPGPPAIEAIVKYDPNGNVVETDEAGRKTTHFYDARGNGVETHLPEGLKDKRGYDSNDNLVSSLRFDGAGFVSGSVSTLDLRNRIKSSAEVLSAGPDGGTTTTALATQIRYDHASNRTMVVDADGKTTKFVTDAAGRQTHAIDGDDVVVSLVQYNDNDLRMRVYVQPPAGVVGTGPGGMLLSRERVYNARNELKLSADALGNVTQNFHDAAGNLIKTIDPAGGVTEFVYDGLGRMTHQLQHVGDGGLGILVTEFKHDGNGNRTEIIDPKGNHYTFQFDDGNRMTELKTPLGFKEKWTYNERGQMKTHTDANGKVATMGYDDLGRLILETHGSPGAEIHREYDGASNLTEIRDTQTGLRIVNAYTKKNELKETEWFTGLTASFKKLKYEYNENGTRKTMTGPEAELYEYAYDTNNRPTAVLRGGVVFGQFEYDAGGRRTKVNLNNGVTVSYTYTEREEVETLVAKTAAGQVILDYEFKYDANGNRTKIEVNHLGTTMDAEYLPVVDWLASEKWTGTVFYNGSQTYDANGNRTGHQKGGETAVYTVDADNRLTQMSTSAAGSPIVDSTAAGFLVDRLVDGVTTDSAGAQFAWSSVDSPQEHWAGLDFGTTVLTKQIVLYIPGAGLERFKFQALVGGEWVDIVGAVFGADPSPQAGWFETSEHVVSMFHEPLESRAVRVLMDAGGGGGGNPNRLRVNELVVPSIQQTIGYGYDANGNQTQRTLTGDGDLLGTELFGYDYANRLNDYHRTDGQGMTQAKFGYLATPTGERFSKTNDLTGEVEAHMYDGADAIADYHTTVGGAGYTHVAGYVQGSGIDSKWVRLDAATGQPTYYVPDGLGSVSRIVDAAGNVVETRLTTVWGEDMPGFAAPGADRHGFTQRERDEGGLMYYRARQYDPRIGRFGQKDPVSPEGDQYIYAFNNPKRYRDPAGLYALVEEHKDDFQITDAIRKEIADAAQHAVTMLKQNMPSARWPDPFTLAQVGVEKALYTDGRWFSIFNMLKEGDSPPSDFPKIHVRDETSELFILAPQFYAGTDLAHHIYINWDKWRKAKNIDERAAILVHELGHAFWGKYGGVTYYLKVRVPNLEGPSTYEDWPFLSKDDFEDVVKEHLGFVVRTPQRGLFGVEGAEGVWLQRLAFPDTVQTTVGHEPGFLDKLQGERGTRVESLKNKIEIE